MSARRGMLRAVTASVPTTHTAGDSFTATLSGSAYPATGGWSAALVLIGAGRYTVSATASGDDHAAAAAPATTAGWVAGQYALRAVYTNAGTGARHSVDVGTLTIVPDPAAGTTDARSLMSQARRALADLEAAYAAHLASGNVHVSMYTIAGRQMMYRTLPDLLKALNAARRDVAAEVATDRARAGLNPRKQFVTRM